jgi:hypothetical protein
MDVIIRGMGIVANCAVLACGLVDEFVVSGLVNMAPDAQCVYPRPQKFSLSARMRSMTGDTRVLVKLEECMLDFRLGIPGVELGVATPTQLTHGCGFKAYFPIVWALMALVAFAVSKWWMHICSYQLRVIGAVRIVATGACCLVKRLAPVGGNEPLVIRVVASRAQIWVWPIEIVFRLAFGRIRLMVHVAVATTRCDWLMDEFLL